MSHSNSVMPRVLIIDNANVVSDYIKPFLQDHGFAVAVVRTHEEASRLLSRTKADVVLNDDNTHCAISGVEFLKRGLNRDVPVIGFANDQLANQAMREAGAVNDFDKGTLLAAIEGKTALAEQFIASVRAAAASKSQSVAV